MELLSSFYSYSLTLLCVVGVMHCDSMNVMALNMTPDRKAVDIPLNVPRNNIGTPRVKIMSQITWVLAMNDALNILQSIIK